jgi:predicted acetyltransferase
MAKECIRLETIRTLQMEELDASFELSQFAFQYVMSNEELEQAKARSKPENTWGYFINNKMAAKMSILPLQTFIQGKAFAMGGIASVATWPEYRRKGLVGQLLQHGLKVMKDNGQTVSFLAPFSFAFYRKYGWEMHVERKKYTVDVGLLPKWEGEGGYIEQTDDIELLNNVYESYAQTYNGTLKRDTDWWKHRVLKKRALSAVYKNKDNIPMGYILYEVKNREMTIHELVFLNESARKGLWRHIFNHDSMLDQVSLIAPSNDPLPFLLSNPRIKQEIIPYFMARIVDVAAFLQQYPFRSAGLSNSFILHVEDTYAPWNHKKFMLDVSEDGAGFVRELADTGEVHRNVISCDIQTLSAMFLGFQSPKLLQRIGRLHGPTEEIERMEQRIGTQTTYLMDFF